jgi:hypothetical protein
MPPRTVTLAADLHRALADPASTLTLSLERWDRLLRLLRQQGLLAHLGWRLEAAGLLERAPEKAREHMLAARVITDDRERMIRWEVDRIEQALLAYDGPLVLLKGAAYVMAGLPVARGRLVSDVDILVPKASLAPVEALLKVHGWEPMKLDPYDQRYYRDWMHELPPLRHRSRNTVVDVHHTILPTTSRLRPDPEKLLAASVPLGTGRARVLSPADMVLHSATHLFQDGDLEHGLRDLVDLHGLLVRFGETVSGFWQGIVPRARELDLGRPLYYTLRHAPRLLGTPVPEAVQAEIRTAGPGWPVGTVMDSLITHTMGPLDPDRRRDRLDVRRWLLYVRSHYLRMPLRLLLPHLWRKSRTQRAGG